MDMDMRVFEDAQRNQLVTEVDIQTQSALDEYQLKLSDIANPTDSQDNVIVSDGELLSHWNETLDFDTWVKLSIDVAGKRLLLLSGNSNVSSDSSIQDTFIHGFDGDLTRWTKIDPNNRFSTASDRLDFTGLTRNEDAYIYKSTSFDDNIIIELTSQLTGGDVGSGIVFEGGLADSINDYLGVPNGNAIWQYAGGGLSQSNKRISSTNYNGNAVNIGTDIRYITYIIIGDTVVATWYSDAGRDTVVATSTNTQSGMPSLVYQYIIQTWNSGSSSAVTGWLDDFRVRKYTATEPTIVVSTPQNIVTALKSFGRTG